MLDNTYSKNLLPLRFILVLMALVTITTVTLIFPVWANFPINILLPAILIFTSTMVPFERIKISTLIIGRILIFHTGLLLLKTEWLIILLAILMYVNILEATVSDFKKKRYLNVVSGLAVLAATHLLFNAEWLTILPRSGEGIIHMGYYLIRSPGIVFWAAAYTIWNWNFVTGEFSPSVSGYHITVLLTPWILVLFFRDPGIWVLARATSLTSAGIFQIRYKKQLESLLSSNIFETLVSKVQHRVVQIIFTVLVICFVILSLSI
jgi:hypothetical protein